MHRFLHDEDKICYSVVHSLLKKRLSRVLNKKEQDIHINYFNNEKPFIHEIGLDFNMSHSGHVFSFIIADNFTLRVGVDIEMVREINNMKSISTDYFSDAECSYVFLPETNETEELCKFYEIWTRKEAFLKMIGIGLYTDLSKIEVTPGMNTINIELTENYKVSSQQAFIYTKRYNDYIISVSLSEDRCPNFQEIID
jgi:4'-phosphopantetheinyl transferase